jgi:hypothetical protein
VKKLIGPLLAAGLLTSCVSLEDPVISTKMIPKDQRTVLIVYPAPGPMYLEEDSKAEFAAKLVPGIGMAVQSVQDDKNIAESKDLQLYIPRWPARVEFSTAAAHELLHTPHPGRWLSASEAGISTATLVEFNHSDNVADWKNRYLDVFAEVPPRDYSRMLELDDALIFEISFYYGLSSEGDGNGTPMVYAFSKLIRANTMHTLWKHEEYLEDLGSKKNIYDHKTHPEELVKRWHALLPQLAQKTAAAYTRALLGLAPLPAAGSASSSLSPSTTTISGRPLSSTSTPSGFPPSQPPPFHP